jgi:hypothetical protein
MYRDRSSSSASRAELLIDIGGVDLDVVVPPCSAAVDTTVSTPTLHHGVQVRRARRCSRSFHYAEGDLGNTPHAVRREFYATCSVPMSAVY